MNMAASDLNTLTTAPVQEVLVGDWKKVKVLGTGGFGMVVLWVNTVINARRCDVFVAIATSTKTDEQIALKEIRWANDPMLTPKHYERWTLEVDIMRRLSHPNVVSAVDVPAVLDSTVKSSSGQIPPPLLAMEYCTGGDLRGRLNVPDNCCGLPESEIRTLLSDVLSALRYLHSLRVIHRDLKPENIVLQEINGKVSYKLIDLGYAKELDQSSLCTSFVGTLQYLAPELFMSQQYTSTVDYWSFGLVAHECITGMRPFLPNFSPAQWIPHVMKKNSEHICANLRPDGTVTFSSALVHENHISGPLKAYMERWLAVMLEWDPQNRGCVLVNGQKDVIAFSMLENVLSKKILTVLYVSLRRYFWYEVDETMSMGHVAQRITTDIGVPKNHLLFLSQHGNPLDLKKGALQCWLPGAEGDEYVIYVFNSDGCPPDSPNLRPAIPSLVEKMLRDNRQAVKYEEQRKMWAHSLFFVSKERAVYRRLLQAHRAITLHLLSKNSSMYKTTSLMVRELSRLTAKLELFEESLQYDVEKYEAQAQQGGITSDVMFKNWLRNRDISRRILHLKEKVSELESKTTLVNTKTIEFQRSAYARNKVPTALEDMYLKTLSAYSELRKRPKESRSIPSDNTEMIRIVVICIKQREKIFRDIQLHLQQLTDCLEDVGKLTVPLQAMLAEIGEHSRQLDVVQRERQADIWKLLENLCKKIRAIKTRIREQPTNEVGGMSLESSMSSSEPVSSGSQPTLSSLLTRSSQEIPSLMSDNLLLRTQLQRMQRNWYEYHTKTTPDNSVDWSFLDDK